MPKPAPKTLSVAARFKASFSDVDELFALAQSRPLDLPLQNKILSRIRELLSKQDRNIAEDVRQWQRSRFGKPPHFWLAPSADEIDPRLRSLALAALRAAIPKNEDKPEGHAAAFCGLDAFAPDEELAEFCREALLGLPLGSYFRLREVADCLRTREQLPERHAIQALGAQRFLDAQAVIAKAYDDLHKKNHFMGSDQSDPLWGLAKCALSEVLSDRLLLADEVAEGLADQVIGVTSGLMVLREALGDAFRVVGVRRLRHHLPMLPARFAQYAAIPGGWQDIFHIIAAEIAVAWAILAPAKARKALSGILAERDDETPEDVATRAACLAGLLALPTVDKNHLALAAKIFAAGEANCYGLLRGVAEGKVRALTKEVQAFSFNVCSLSPRMPDRLRQERDRAIAALT